MRTLIFAIVIALFTFVAKAEEPATVKLNKVRLYQTDAILKERIGGDAGPLADYTKALLRAAKIFWGNESKPTAKGLLVAVGLRPNGESHVWCDSVGGEVSADDLKKLEEVLEKVKPIAVNGGPVAFSLELGLNDQMPADFPEMPQAWTDAVKKAKKALDVPDGVFDVLWPK